MNQPGPQTITPERQIAAAQVGQTFNSVAQYLQSLAPVDNEGRLVVSEDLNEARKALQVASYWAIQHILKYGTPPAPAANEEAPPPVPPAAPPEDRGSFDPPAPDHGVLAVELPAPPQEAI